MSKPKGTKSPSSRNRDEGMLTAANLNRRPDQYGITDATTNRKQIGFEVKTDSSKIYPVKPDGKLYRHDFEKQFGPTSGPRATTVYPNNPLLNQMFMSPEEGEANYKNGINPSEPWNVQYLKKNRILPNEITYNLNHRGQVASEESEPFIRAEERREAAEYAKKSCWEKLMECFKSKKSKKNMQGGSIGGAGVTIKDLRDFLDANQDIKNILVNDECPLGPTEQMINNVDKFTDMLENSEKPDITIDEIYNQDAGKRRKKTRKAKRRPRKTRKAKRRTKRRN